MKKLLFAVTLLLGVTLFAQETKKPPVEDLKAQKAKKDAEIAKLQGESGALAAQISSYPGWKFGAIGTIGANFSGFNNWYSNAVANSENGSIGIIVNGFANLDQDKFFWRNSGSLNLGWTKIDNLDDPTDSNEFNATTDVFTINSLFGYKLSKILAASAMAEYRTTVIENFNDPGYLDLGVGATWTPIPELVVVLHPLNYNFVFAKEGADYENTLGCKFMAEFNKDLGYLKYRSNFSGFYSYKGTDYSNWTWVNSLGFNLYKGIGVGLEAGLRQNRQESFNKANTGTPAWTKLEQADNKLQSYWLVGLNYGF